MSSDLQSKDKAKNGNPLVSIILPVYNGIQYLREAIDSILNQSFTNVETIIIDDGSSDDSAAVISSYKDPRFRFIQQDNQGLAAALNRGITLASGSYIARMDQDDVSLQERLSRQISFLESNPDYGMVGTWAEIWAGDEKTGRWHKHPTENMPLQFELLFNNPFVHSSTMIRKTVFDKVGLYATDTSRQPPEDYELWSRIARKFKVANIPEVLHVYREIPKSMSRNGITPFLDHLVTICAENIAWRAGVALPNAAATNIAALVHGAQHRLQGTPNFREMHVLLKRAVIGTISTEDPTRFIHEAEKRLYALQFAYWDRRLHNRWLKYIVRAARSGFAARQRFQVYREAHK